MCASLILSLLQGHPFAQLVAVGLSHGKREARQLTIARVVLVCGLMTLTRACCAPQVHSRQALVEVPAILALLVLLQRLAVLVSACFASLASLATSAGLLNARLATGRHSQLILQAAHA